MIISRSVHVTGQKASFHSFLCLSNILVCVCVCLCTTSSKNRVIAIPFLGTVCCFVAKSCITLRPHGLYLTRLFCPWDFPGKNTGVGCHFLLQGIFLTQGSKPGLLHCKQILYHLSHQGSLYMYICICVCVYVSL